VRAQWLLIVAAVALAGCKELTPTEQCAEKGEVFAGHTGDEIRCDVPVGRQNVCVVEATKRYVDDSWVAFGYRWRDSSDKALDLLTAVLTCQTTFPCGEEGNGPCDH
jgi:hypothetical protein